MEFEWEDGKARANLRKHRVDFADAATMFDDKRAVTMADDAPEEERYVTIGMDALGGVLVAGCCLHNTGRAHQDHFGAPGHQARAGGVRAG